MLSHPYDTCHRHHFHHHFFLLSVLFLTRTPSSCLSLAPHPSHWQTLVHSTSPLAPRPGLPSNNFISFPPLSHRPAPLLTTNCSFLSERKKKTEGYIGPRWEPNNSWQRAGHWTVILMAAVGMYGPKVTQKACFYLLIQLWEVKEPAE